MPGEVEEVGRVERVCVLLFNEKKLEGLQLKP